jgi:hypothetical protein
MPVDTSRFKSSLKDYERHLVAAVKRGMQKNVEQLEKEAKALAPYKTGQLEGNTETAVTEQAGKVVGSVQFNVPYAARQHNDLSLRPGPGTRAKSPTKYGTPGQNYLLNPARGMAQDGTLFRNIIEEEK